MEVNVREKNGVTIFDVEKINKSKVTISRYHPMVVNLLHLKKISDETFFQQIAFLFNEPIVIIVDVERQLEPGAQKWLNYHWGQAVYFLTENEAIASFQ